MSGMDVVQVIASVAELARISYSLYQFFQRVRRANVTARESCQKIKELHRVVHGVELALRRREDQVSREQVAHGEEMVWGHVRSSTRRCHKILLKIRREFTAFNIETDPSIIESAIRQIRFDLRKEVLIECYIELDTNIQALQINTQTLNIFIQVGTNERIDSRTNEVLAAIAKLQRLHNRANYKLNLLLRNKEQQMLLESDRPRFPSVSIGPAHTSQDAVVEQDESPDDIEMMRGTLDVAWEIITKYEPTDESVMDRKETAWSESEKDDDSDDSDDLKETNLLVSEPGLTISPVRFLRPSSGLLHDHSKSRRMLDNLIQAYQSRVENALEKDHVHAAEEDQLKVMEYAEERSRRYDIPYNKIRMLEQLALIYKKQSKHQDVFKVLTGLLPKTGEANVLTAENSKHHQMLAESYYELWTVEDQREDLLDALGHAHTAFTTREKQKEPDEKLIQESGKLLADIYEALNQPVEAEAIRAMLPIEDKLPPPPHQVVNATPQVDNQSTSEEHLPDGTDVNKELIPTIKARNLSRLRALLQSKDLDIERQGRHSWTPLMYAFKYSEGSESMPLALLENSASIDAEDDDGRTVLHQAAASGHTAMIRLAIRRDATKEARDKERLTPLLVAVKENHRECKHAVEALLEAGCSAKAQDKDGWTVLHHAAHNSATSSHPFNTIASHLLDYLLEKSNAVVDAKDRAEYTALARVIGTGDVKTVESLLNHGADPNALNRAGKSLLYLAVHEKPDQPKYSSVIKLLLKYGAVVRQEDFLAVDYQRFKYLLKRQDDKSRRLSDSSIREIERIPSFSTVTSGVTIDTGRDTSSGAGDNSPTSFQARRGTGLKIKNIFSRSGS